MPISAEVSNNGGPFSLLQNVSGTLGSFVGGISAAASGGFDVHRSATAAPIDTYPGLATSVGVMNRMQVIPAGQCITILVSEHGITGNPVSSLLALQSGFTAL